MQHIPGQVDTMENTSALQQRLLDAPVKSFAPSTRRVPDLKGREEQKEDAAASAEDAAESFAVKAENTRVFPSIFLNTQPKSGSVFLFKSLTAGLGLRFTRIGTTGYPETLIEIEQIRAFKQGGAISQLHIDANPINLLFLCINLDKMLLHIRDPRNSMISWLHYMDHINETCPQVGESPQYLPYIGTCWTSATFEEKFERCVSFFYKESIAWLQQWFDAMRVDFSRPYVARDKKGRKPGCNAKVFTLNSRDIQQGHPKFADCRPCEVQVLLTTHEDLVHAGEAAFLDAILDFYGIGKGEFTKPEMKRDMTNHIRTGRTDTWKHELTPAQQETVNALLPQAWRTCFGWD